MTQTRSVRPNQKLTSTSPRRRQTTSARFLHRPSGTPCQSRCGMLWVKCSFSSCYTMPNWALQSFAKLCKAQASGSF